MSSGSKQKLIARGSQRGRGGGRGGYCACPAAARVSPAPHSFRLVERIRLEQTPVRVGQPRSREGSLGHIFTLDFCSFDTGLVPLKHAELPTSRFAGGSQTKRPPRGLGSCSGTNSPRVLSPGTLKGESRGSEVWTFNWARREKARGERPGAPRETRSTRGRLTGPDRPWEAFSPFW